MWNGTMLRPMRHALAVLAAASMQMGIGAAAAVEGAAPTRLAVLDFGFFDTSGEPQNQEAAHAARLAAMAETVRSSLAAGDLFDVVTMSATADGPCPDPDPERDPACVLPRARERGIDLVLTGVVHKASTMLLDIWISGYDPHTAERVLDHHLSFRGDNDESWRRAALFLARQIEEQAPGRASAGD